MIAVIGGTGLYRFLSGATEEVTVDTPYGPTSAPVTLGEIAGREVAFLPRHGRNHEYSPHTVPYRANLWALRRLGATKVLAPCAVGSLDPAAGPGTITVPDQLVDRTSGRTSTFFDGHGVHVSFADPYCPVLRAAAAPGADRASGTMVVIEGPRFSTRAESRWYAAQGWDLVNMTGLPEAALARELKLCYASIALVTDLDAGIEAGEGVHTEDVLAQFRANLPRLTDVLARTIATVDPAAPCECARGDHDLPDGLDAGPVWI
ncbi:S-methyl-5'-thioadenosine phosphorylase [Tsukamurella pseudospumae]|uniref:Purine nucleoside phosphorylase n=1 Tax=Tsukamurella pseudospumae TaxID=239498 RepID=A0A137ZMU1_9ACTN|nr:S-methyl-5'-thioadenosine phosphorylase [Tsukamurella pseudospumae]KXO99514.1 5'-methylthioadenosine phosphorylase [Tsukamurella pseudospumae]